ncbi:MAG: thioredoxin [Planctomycetaceae bacterium]
MGKAVEFTEQNFQEQVLDAPMPVLVDFWAPWCGPCRNLAPTIDELATENEGVVRIGKLNIDEANSLAAQYHIQSIPTLMIFKGGRVVQQIMGAQPKARIQQALDEAKI